MNILHIKISQPCVELEETQLYRDERGEKVDLGSKMKKISVTRVEDWAKRGSV